MGKDGRTPHERAFGRRAAKPIAEFGEKVWYKVGKKQMTEKLAPRWEEGVFFMRRDKSDEVVIGTQYGTKRTRSFRRMPESDRWDKAFVEQLQGYPWKPDGDNQENKPDDGEEFRVDEEQIRRL